MAYRVITSVVVGVVSVAVKHVADYIEQREAETIEKQNRMQKMPKPMMVDEVLVNSLYGDMYVFTHKAIWGCGILLPSGVSFLRDVVNATLVELPSIEHWAFVARGECRAVDPPRVAYFVAQFCEGEVIPSSEETVNLDDPLFRAMLHEKNKEVAALSIIQGSSNPDVWIQTPRQVEKRYVYKKDELVSADFVLDEWVPMRRPMKLRELNDRIYQTRCTGKKYDPRSNNCQHFAMDLFDETYPDETALFVDEPLMNCAYGELYVFSHKAIWACYTRRPTDFPVSAEDSEKLSQKLPYIEQKAFVARGECNDFAPPRVLYYIALVGYIDEELNQSHNNLDHDRSFKPLLQESKKAAALTVLGYTSKPDVWISSPDQKTTRFVCQNKQLVRPRFRQEEWVPMKHTMKLRELNETVHHMWKKSTLVKFVELMVES